MRKTNGSTNDARRSRDGVATSSRLLKIIGLFCRISSLLKGSFAKETYNFKEPTNMGYWMFVTRWLQVVGSLKIYASCAEYRGNGEASIRFGCVFVKRDKESQRDHNVSFGNTQKGRDSRIEAN